MMDLKLGDVFSSWGNTGAGMARGGMQSHQAGHGRPSAQWVDFSWKSIPFQSSYP